MPTKQMTIQYVNSPKPGRERGSIKGTDGTLLGAFGQKIRMFEVGCTYDIEYTEAEANGQVYRNVKSAVKVTGLTSLPSTASPSISPAKYQTHPADSRRMFLTSILNAAIQCGQVSVFDKKQLAEATANIQGLYVYAYGEKDDEAEPGEPASRTGTR